MNANEEETDDPKKRVEEKEAVMKKLTRIFTRKIRLEGSKKNKKIKSAMKKWATRELRVSGFFKREDTPAPQGG